MHTFCHCRRGNDLGFSRIRGRPIADICRGDQLFMAPDQFENSRVSDGTLRTERHASRAADSTTAESEISNMIAEGSPAPREAAIPPTDRPRIRGIIAASTLIGNRVLMSAGEELGNIEEIML